jgi:hypothetical protein
VIICFRKNGLFHQNPNGGFDESSSFHQNKFFVLAKSKNIKLNKNEKIFFFAHTHTQALHRRFGIIEQ